ncbi:MAG: DivIVA domain-containing protein [Candidatus Omnitrophota bacterium]
MKLTPQDLLKQQFGIKGKGFDREEVTQFLALAANTLENEILEQENLKKELVQTQERLSHLQKREDLLRDTLISAQKFSQEIRANAEKEAGLILKESELKAEAIVNAATQRQRQINEEIRNLKFKRAEIENDILSMLHSMRQIIDAYRKTEEEAN